MARDQNALLREFAADLEAFFVEDVEANATAALHEAAQLAAEAIVVGNQYGPGAPVDTGFLRASFRIGIGAPASGPSAPPKSTGRRPGDAPQFAAPPIGPEVLQAQLGQTIFITTNVQYGEYVEFLEQRRRYGKFAGASTTFIRPVELRWPRIVEDVVARVAQSNPRSVRVPR